MMLNEQVYHKDVHLLTSKEKEETILQLREKVNMLEDQKNSYKKLSEDVLFAYERMKELYELQSEKNSTLKDENQMLLNDINFLRYELNQCGDDFNQQRADLNIDDNFTTSSKQQMVVESPMAKKHGLGGLNALPTFSLNIQSAANNGSALNSDLNAVNQMMMLKQRTTLSRQFSTNSISSNGGTANPNSEMRKLIEGEQEDSEKIELAFNQNQRMESYKKFNLLQIPLPHLGPLESQLSNMHENKQLPFLNANNFKDDASRLEAEMNYRLTARLGELLFQDFLLIGPSLDEINGKCAIGEGGINAHNQNNDNGGNASQQGLYSNLNAAGYKNANDQEEVLFSQAILIDLVKGKLDTSQQEVASKHPFPFKVKCKKFRVKNYEDFMQDVYKKVFTESKVQDIKQFTFTMEGENIMMPKSAIKFKDPPVIEGSNPNRRQYCVYFEWDDYIFSERDKNTLYKCPFMFCFITYYPFFSFFREVVCHMISRLQKERIPLFSIHNKISQSFLSLDARWIISEFEQDVSIYKRKLLELQLHKPEIQQMIHFNLEEEEEDEEEQEQDHQQHQQQYDQQDSPKLQVNRKIGNAQSHTQSKVFSLHRQTHQPDYSAKVSFMVPHYRQLKYLEVSQFSGSNLILQLLTFDDFWLILSLVMLEQQVVFFSQNIQYIAGAIQTFASIYKPFNKSMLIFHIFEDTFVYLETPPPFMGGINLPSKLIMQNKLICEDSVRVNFIDLDLRKIYLSQETIHIFESQNAFMNYSKYIYELRKTYSILAISPYKNLSNFSFESHSQIKLSNQMLYQQPPVPPSFLINLRNSQNQPGFIQALTQTTPIPIIKNMPKSTTQIPNISQSSNQLLQLKDQFNEKSSQNMIIENRGKTIRTQNELQDESKIILEYQRSQYYQYIKDIKAKAIEEIFALLEQTFQYYILDNLPRDANIDTNSKDYLERILKKCEEKNFTGVFLYTQNFQYYFQQYKEGLQIKPNTASTKATHSYPTTANSQNRS